MKLSGGYLTLATVRGAPVRLHVTVLLVAIAFFATHHVPALLSYLALILLHELGHATLARAFGQRLLNIDVHAFGGHCLWRGTATPKQRAAIAWGGVLAQLGVLVGTAIAFRLAHSPRPAWSFEVVTVLVGVNAVLILFNLLPIAPLDGAVAWSALTALGRPRQVPPARPRVQLPQMRVTLDMRRPAQPPPVPAAARTTVGPSAKKKPVIQVIRARSASELLRELDAEEDRGNLPDVRDLVDQIFKKSQKNKRDLPN